MHVQRLGQDLVIILPAEVVQKEGLKEGDEVVVVKTVHPANFDEAFEQILRDHADTFIYLQDK